MLFETGYGPSGLPHIGTFGEVARTTMVRHAFRVLTEDKIKTRLLAFSDDMDGLRKVPDNVPNEDMMAAHLGKPLTRVPDPFSNEYPSFGAANNARLRAFLDHFGFDYEFASSTDYYTSGRFDATLLKMLAAYDKVMAIILPTLRAGPPRDLFAVPADQPDHRRRAAGADDPPRRRRRHHHLCRSRTPARRSKRPVTGGNVKCQWKADWAMRWVALGVDYEMAGKDLIDFGEAVRPDRQGARRHAAGRLQLRTLPRREGPEDFEVEGQRPHHRRMAALCVAGIAVAVHVPRAEGGEAAVFRRHPAQRRRLPAIPRRLSAAGCASSSSPIRSGTSMPAIRRRPTCPSRSSCC